MIFVWPLPVDLSSMIRSADEEPSRIARRLTPGIEIMKSCPCFLCSFRFVFHFAFHLRIMGVFVILIAHQCCLKLHYLFPASFHSFLFSTCGLSNYLFMAQLKDHVPIRPDEPRKVLIRVYGEVLRSSMDSIVLDSINFAILSEKRMGPALHGVFPGGRIEEFIQSRSMVTSELGKPAAMKAVAQQLARIHNLNMPFCKQPRFIFKMMDKFLAQLSGKMDPPTRPLPNISMPSLQALEQEYLSDRELDSTWSECGFEYAQRLAVEFKIYEEYDWLKYVQLSSDYFLLDTEMLLPMEGPKRGKCIIALISDYNALKL
ncbi:unnamed protein product [Echinostoma caproni]|uniref:Uncharacterized protein n=1 Tax=Echinostoma caproni TaxID=27848 RepID=A0A3P8I9H5_9TREM|nr:unnamed protein product [Echinostoma caproni]